MNLQEMQAAGVGQEEIANWVKIKGDFMRQAGFNDMEISQTIGAEPVRFEKPITIEPSHIQNILAVSHEPPSFDIDRYVNEWGKTQPIENGANNESAIAKIFHSFTQPFLAQHYSTNAAFNRGMGMFMANIDTIDEWAAKWSRGILKSGVPWKDVAKEFEKRNEYWGDRASKVGAGFIDELIGEAVGGLIPGMGEFIFGLTSGLAYPAALGAARAEKKGESQIAGAFIEAAKTGTLAGIFELIGPLRIYLKSPAMGTVGAIQAAMEGAEPKDILKSGMIMAGYGASSPGGKMGLNEIKTELRSQMEVWKPGMRKAVEAGKEILKSERGAVGEKLPPEPPEEVKIGEPEQKPRKFLQTVEKSNIVDERTKEILREIQKEEPQIYNVQTNPESIKKANEMLDIQGSEAVEKYLLSDKPFDADKVAAFLTLRERLEQNMEFDRSVMLMDNLSVQAVKAGQGIQMLSYLTRGTPQGFVKWAEKQIDSVKSKYSWADTLFKNEPLELTHEDKVHIAEEWARISKMPDGVEKANETLGLIDFVARNVPPSVNELIDAYRYQNMLLGPRTQLKNIGENILNAWGTRPFDLTMKAGIDWIKSGLTGSDRQAYISDVPLYYKTSINALPNALNAFVSTWKMESGTTIGKPELGIETKTAFQQARAKQIPKVLTVVQRFMEASDKFNQSLISAGEFAIRKRQGQIDAEAYQGATELAQEYLYRAELKPDDPKLSLFSKALSELGVLVTTSRKYPVIGKPSSWMIPFMRTPINKGIQMIEHSPLGVIRGEWSEEAAAKIVGGSIIGGVGALAAYLGETQWAVPTDPKEKEWFYATKRLPFSWREPKTGISIPFWYLGPFSLSFALPTAVKYYTEDSKKSLDDNAIDKLLKISEGTARFIGSQSSVQSIGSFFSIMAGDTDFNTVNTLGFAAGQFIPAEGFIRWVNTLIDPVYRKPDGFVETMMKDVPWLSMNLEVRKTPFGFPSKRTTLNTFLPYDIGISEPMYEPGYSIQQQKKNLFKIQKGMTKSLDEVLKEFQKQTNK